MRWFDSKNGPSVVEVSNDEIYDRWLLDVRSGHPASQLYTIVYEDDRIILITGNKERGRIILGLKE